MRDSDELSIINNYKDILLKNLDIYNTNKCKKDFCDNFKTFVKDITNKLNDLESSSKHIDINDNELDNIKYQLYDMIEKCKELADKKMNCYTQEMKKSGIILKN